MGVVYYFYTGFLIGYKNKCAVALSAKDTNFFVLMLPPIMTITIIKQDSTCTAGGWEGDDKASADIKHHIERRLHYIVSKNPWLMVK